MVRSLLAQVVAGDTPSVQLLQMWFALGASMFEGL